MKISIITPCFNAEETIEKTIQSVLSQKGELEYIIIDGKSTDGTLDIIKKYYQIYPNIIMYISEKDNSMTEALNKGMKMATGDVWACLNADDIYLGDTFEKIRNAFESRNYDVVMGNTIVVNEKGEEFYIRKPRFKSLFAWKLMGCLVNSSAVFFRKDFIDRIGYFEENLRYTQDLEFYLRAIKSKGHIVHLNQNISYFTLSAEQLSSKFNEKMLEEAERFMDNFKLYSFLSKTKLLTLLRILTGVYYYPSLDAFKRHLKESLGYE